MLQALAMTAALFAVVPLCADEGDESTHDVPPVRVDVRPDTIAFLLPGHWGALGVSAVNAQSEPANLLCITSFVEDQNLQYGRRIWVPPQSRMQGSYHVLAPEQSTEDQKRFDCRTLLYDEDLSAETPIRQEWGRPQQDDIVRIGNETPVTVVLGEPDTMESRPDRVGMLKFVHAVRCENNLVRNLTPVRDLPAGETALDAVDHLVIADDRLTQDLATLSGVRRWLYGGGRAWVMLDRVDPSILETLLGDAFDGQIVDRVGLTSVQITPGPDYQDLQSGPKWSSDYEQPAELVRLLTSEAVGYEVNGWPAAIWMKCGQGRLLITTLGADGWGRPRTPRDPAPLAGHTYQNDWFPGPPLQQLATAFFVRRNASPVPEDIADEHVRADVGYMIPSGTQVLGVLAGFVLVLAGAASWLSWKGRLEWMGLVGPVAAVVCGAVLVVTGYLQRGVIPPSVATLQYVQPILGTSDVRITGAAAVFSPTAGTAHLAGTEGGWIRPDMAGMEETVRRLIWTDQDQWQWENVPESPGLRTAELLDSHRLPAPVQLECQLDERGVVGQFSLPAGLSPSDGVVATPWGRIGVEFGKDGTLRAEADSVLTDEQFLAASVLTDEQALRSRMLKTILSASDDRPNSLPPTLFFWTNPWKTALQFDEKSRQTGAALVTLPVKLNRPPAETEITIPAPLLAYRETIGPDGGVPTGFFNSHKLVWERKHQPASSWLQFQVPPSLLPIEPQRARVVIRVDGPVGKLSIDGARGEEIVPVKTWVDPVGTLELTIDDARQLSLTDDGRLLIRVSGGDPDRPELTHSSSDGVERVSYWKIESLSLELQARIPAAENGGGQ